MVLVLEVVGFGLGVVDLCLGLCLGTVDLGLGGAGLGLGLDQIGLDIISAIYEIITIQNCYKNTLTSPLEWVKVKCEYVNP